MTIRYTVGTTEHTADVLTGGMTLADHLERLDPRNSSGTEWVTFALAGGGEIALRDSVIVAIERHATEP